MSILRYVADSSVVKITTGTGGIQNLPTGSANNFFNSGLTLIYSLAGIVAVIIIIIAGFMYATSSGDSAVITRAKTAILYSVIGLIVIALAFVITQYIIGVF